MKRESAAHDATSAPITTRPTRDDLVSGIFTTWLIAIGVSGVGALCIGARGRVSRLRAVGGACGANSLGGIDGASGTDATG